MVGQYHHVHDSMDMSLSKLCEVEKDSEAWRVEVLGVAKSWTQLSDCMTTTYVFFGFKGSQLRHVRSSVFAVASGIFSCTMWDLVP